MYKTHELKRAIKDLVLNHGKMDFRQDPVQVNNNVEYYKNGNVQAYRSVLKINDPWKKETIRNRDYGLYTENFDVAYIYLELLHYSRQYNQNIKEFYKTLNREHVLGTLELDFLDDIKDEKLKNYQFKKEPDIKSFDNLPFRPYRTDAPYNYEPTPLGKWLLYGLIKKYYIGKQYENKLRLFDNKMEVRDKDKRQFYDTLYKTKAENASIENKISTIEKQFNGLWNGYVSFENEQSVQAYIDYMFDKLFEPEIPYVAGSTHVTVDLKTHSLIVDHEIPGEFDLPRIESFKAVKKKGAAKVYKFSAKTFHSHYNASISSHILYLIGLLNHIDEENLFDSVYINLYEQFTDDILKQSKCLFACKAYLENINNIDFMSDNASSYLETLTNQRFDIENLNEDVDPVRKGRD